MYKKCIGIDGIDYDSIAESSIAEWLYLRGIQYEPHKNLPKPSKQKCDFYLPEHNLWVEYDGLMQVRELSSCDAHTRASKKVSFYEKNKMNYIVLTRDNWEEKLYEALLL